MGNLPALPNQSEKIVWDGAKIVTLIDGREVYRYVPPAPTTYLAPPPLVADLSGKRRILVRNSSNVSENKDLVGPVVLTDAFAGHWTAYSFPSVASLHADGKPLVFHHGALALALVTDLEGRPVWHFGMTRDTAGKWGQFVDVDGDGRREILHAQPDGVLRCFTPGPPARCPTCPLAGGKGSDQRWHLDLGRPISRLIAADLDGDGRRELLFGSDDGKLHALGERDGKPRLLWSVALGRRVGEPILADLDGDGRPEVLVAAEDGKLYCLKGK